MSSVAPKRFVGIDLAWSTGRTGIASLDADGALRELHRCEPHEDVAAAVRALEGHLDVVAVDAPVVVGNDTGQRGAEKAIGRTWGAYGASPYSTSRAQHGDRSRARRLADALGWDVAPDAVAAPGLTRCIEVYPHPALVGLFELPYRLACKKGGTAARLPGFRELVDRLGCHPALHLDEHPRWREIGGLVAGEPAPGELDRVEDEVDAVVCALIALLWSRTPELLQIYGDGVEGYIVAPVPPRHPAVRPLPRAVRATGGARAERWVSGRPTGSAGGAHEQAWKAAVRASFADTVLPAGTRVFVHLEFRLTEGQVGRAEPDLDDLVKATIDALDGVLGARPGTARQRVEADDVRVTRLTASKGAAGGRPSGALIVVEELVDE